LKKSQRKTIYHARKGQRVFLYPVIIAFFIGCAISWLSLLYFSIGEFVFTVELFKFQKIIPGILAALTVAMIMLILWTLGFSSRHIGSHERIINNLK